MPDERTIRAAERAKLAATIADQGTKHERLELMLSAILRAGLSIAQLAGDDAAHLLARAKPDPELLARITRRLELRQRLDLPATDCASRSRRPAPGCSCLSDTLDGGQDLTRETALVAARKLHRQRWPHRKAAPRPKLKALPVPFAELETSAVPESPPKPDSTPDEPRQPRRRNKEQRPTFDPDKVWISKNGRMRRSAISFTRMKF